MTTCSLEATLPPSAAVGRWMFRHRTQLPVPFACLLLVSDQEGVVVGRVHLAGAVLILVGELLRLWAVRHIGTISRTRSDRLGPLVVSGPFALVRNPLYLGNLLLWSGLASSWAGVWMLPLCWMLFGAKYYLITRWEEHHLQLHFADAYREYAERVPAWVPRLASRQDVLAPPRYRWREALFGERGTLVGLGAMAAVLALRLFS